MISFKNRIFLGPFWFSVVVETRAHDHFLVPEKVQNKNHTPPFVLADSDLHLNARSHSITVQSSVLSVLFHIYRKVQTRPRCHDERRVIWCELSRDFLFSFLFAPPPPPPSSVLIFSVFFIPPPVCFPLCGVPFIEIAMEVVCVCVCVAGERRN